MSDSQPSVEKVLILPFSFRLTQEQLEYIERLEKAMKPDMNALICGPNCRCRQVRK